VLAAPYLQNFFQLFGRVLLLRFTIFFLPFFQCPVIATFFFFLFLNSNKFFLVFFFAWARRTPGSFDCPDGVSFQTPLDWFPFFRIVVFFFATDSYPSTGLVGSFPAKLVKFLIFLWSLINFVPAPPQHADGDHTPGGFCIPSFKGCLFASNFFCPFSHPPLFFSLSRALKLYSCCPEGRLDLSFFRDFFPPIPPFSWLTAPTLWFAGATFSFFSFRFPLFFCSRF